MQQIPDWHSWFTLIVIGGILVLLLRDRARPEFIFTGGLGLLLAGGILTPSQAFSGFSNEAVFTVGALFIIAAGVQKTRALGFLEKLIFPDHTGIRGVMIRMMGATAVMSAFLNNTPIVAMLIPQVREWADRTGKPVAKLLIPLSYAAIVGGIVTLIGTSTNLIVSGMLVQRGYAPLGFFELTWIGLPAVILVLLWFIIAGHGFLPDRNITEMADDIEYGIGSAGTGGKLEDVKGNVNVDGNFYSASNSIQKDKGNRNGTTLAGMVTGEAVEENSHGAVSGNRPGRGNGNSYQFDLKVPAHSPLVNQTVEQAGLRALGNAFLVHIHRNGHIIGPVGPTHRLENDDVLTFIGEMKHVDDLAVRKGLVHTVPVLDEPADEDLPLFEAVVSASSPLVGRTLKNTGFRDRYRGVVVGIKRRDETIRGALGNIPILPGDLLLIESNPGFDERWNGNRHDFYLVSGKGRRDLPVSRKAPVALTILISMVGAAAAGWVPVVTAAFVSAILMILTGCVQTRQIFGAMNLPILLVIASALGVGQALETTGLAYAGGTLLLDLTSSYGFIAVIIAIYVTTNLLTEVITNNAAAVLMVPLAMASAYEIGMDPHAAAVTVAVAASASFLTPIGYQTNLMVMGAGGYRFSDYFRAGIPVTLILMTVTVTMVYLKWL
jgi:di/tricarboxylate transporter